MTREGPGRVPVLLSINAGVLTLLALVAFANGELVVGALLTIGVVLMVVGVNFVRTKF